MNVLVAKYEALLMARKSSKKEEPEENSKIQKFKDSKIQSIIRSLTINHYYVLRKNQ